MLTYVTIRCDNLPVRKRNHIVKEIDSMKTLARLIAPLMALCLAACIGEAWATDQSANPNTWLRGGPVPFYGRSDGIFYHRTYKSPRLIGNGDGYMPIGPTYYEEFSSGDAIGVVCESLWRQVFTKAAGDNAACATTCGSSDCLFGLEDTMDDSDDLLDCAGATADGCLCVTSPGDEILDGCGANWETPALGQTLMSFQSGTKLVYVALLDQALGPDMDATGLDIASDQTNNDGVEILGGMYGASGRPMVPGIDPAFKFCATVNVTDVSGTDQFYVGWRDMTAPNATFGSYNSYAVVGLNAGDTVTLTEDDGGGTTTTDIDTGDIADTSGFVKYCALVSDAGVFSSTTNGESPTNGASYTFDSGVPVIPIIHFLHDSDVADEIIVTEWEVSYQ